MLNFKEKRATKGRNLRWTLSSWNESDVVYESHRTNPYSITGLTREQNKFLLKKKII